VVAAQLGDLQLQPLDLQFEGVASGVCLRGLKSGHLQRSPSDLQITRGLRPLDARRTRRGSSREHQRDWREADQGDLARFECATDSLLGKALLPIRQRSDARFAADCASRCPQADSPTAR
jgi:hypothetical protein